VQVKTRAALVQLSQPKRDPVYVSDVPEFAPVAQLTQAEFVVSHKYPASVSQLVEVPVITLASETAHDIYPT